METLEVIELISKGESSKVQFKERLKDAHSVSQEMVAFANLHGGIILIGIEDKTGKINGLSFKEIQKHNEFVVNAANNNIKPELFVETEQISVDRQIIMLVQIPEGLNKPYKDKNGVIWIKNGSDKRRVTSNEELARLLQAGKNIFADEQMIQTTTYSDFDKDKFKKYIEKRYQKPISDLSGDIRKLAANSNLIKNEHLTLTGLLLFGKNAQLHKPLFTIKCVAFADNEASSTNYLDKEQDITGNLKEVFDKSMNFIIRNLHKKQTGTSFNSTPELEIPPEVFEELLVNALIHRDYFINSVVKVFIFPNRIEIISPGKLPNSLTVENILNGISIPRNPTLQSIAQIILPYSGLGTGLIRINRLYDGIQFKNNITNEVFTVTIKRR